MNSWRIKSVVYSAAFRFFPFSLIRAREHANLQRLFAAIDPHPTDVIDIGSGVGGGLFWDTSTIYTTCVDSALFMIRRLSPETFRIVAAAGLLPLRPRSQRVMTAVGLLEYLPNQESFIAEASRILKIEGYLLLTVAPKGLWSLLRNALGNRIYPVRLKQWDEVMKRCGFTALHRDRSLMQHQMLYRFVQSASKTNPPGEG